MSETLLDHLMILWLHANDEKLDETKKLVVTFATM